VKGLSRIPLAIKALRELGLRQLVLYGIYQLGLKSGYFRWRTRGDRPRTEDRGPQTTDRRPRNGDSRQRTEDSGPPSDDRRPPSAVCRPITTLPDPAEVSAVIGSSGYSNLVAVADEIVAGQVRLFSGDAVPLELSPPGELAHWTAYEQGKVVLGEHGEAVDIKFIWEPARFGWAFSLARAYFLTTDERYPGAFWRYFEVFQQSNPVNLGPNWASAQEVGLRILAFAFAAQVFDDSRHSTTTRKTCLAEAVAAHAGRIPATLVYARAQDNNHLLSEAAGLITAAVILPDHPQAHRWAKLGWKWFNEGLRTQIMPDGTYTQHSTNYHRLMLQLALWVSRLRAVGVNLGGIPVGREADHGVKDGKLSAAAISNTRQAVRWALAFCDPETGRVPNLGANDGTYILPMTVLPFEDYRPVLQAVSREFLGEPAFQPGPWDEMGLWLGSKCAKTKQPNKPYVTSKGYILWRKLHNELPEPDGVLRSAVSWAYLRAARFNGRPGHADQLHLDLWWRGLNVAQDAGTYLYNALVPWDNALTHTAVHNTVMVDGREQMTRAGRFLYLDRAQAEILKHETAEDGSSERITAQHDGYLPWGMVTTRQVTIYQDDRWLVEDLIQPRRDEDLIRPWRDEVQGSNHEVRLHWLLPDWTYKILPGNRGIRIQSPYGWVRLEVKATAGPNLQPATPDLQLVRSGVRVYGTGEVSPTWGWVSPTYGLKVPALSLGVVLVGPLPVTLVSEWSFPSA
jgi:hypothetical protein